MVPSPFIPARCHWLSLWLPCVAPDKGFQAFHSLIAKRSFLFDVFLAKWELKTKWS